MESQLNNIVKILILQSRGLGDAIISTSLINSICESYENVLIDVWASPEIAPIFENQNSIRRCHIQPLPLIKRHKFTLSSLSKLVSQVYKLRKIEYDLCLNVVGDMRENLLVAMVGAKKTYSVTWDDYHPFKKHIRPGFSWLINQNIEIPKECLNIYSVYQYFALRIGCSNVAGAGFKDKKINSAARVMLGERKCVAIHPLAGSPSREWPFQKWNELIKMILRLDYDVLIVGELSRRKELEIEFVQWRNEKHVSIETVDIAKFLKMLSDMSLLIGLDSFPIHAARAVGVPVVMINGSNDPAVWGPPGIQILGSGGGCKDYPCYNRPKCIGSDGEYVCVRAVPVTGVIAAVENIMIPVNIYGGHI